MIYDKLRPFADCKGVFLSRLAGKHIMKNEKTKTTGRKFGISATAATVVVAVGFLARKCTKDFEKSVIAESK